jgi:glycosyltransferase involved in cell wall biosynthesis
MVEYVFITPAALVSINGVVTTFGASARLGSIAPTRALTSLGYDARTYSVAGDTAPAEQALAQAKRVVFGEMFANEHGWAGPAATYRRLLELIPERWRIVFSIADDHFDNVRFRDFYTEALPHCLAVTTVSAQLADTVKKLTSRPVLVAPEPCEGVRGLPHAFAARKPPAPLAWLARRIGLSDDLWRMRLLWFGYPANLAPLIELLPALQDLARKHPLSLTCVTQPVAEIAALTREEGPLHVRFIPWTPTVMDAVISTSDVVLIPAHYRNPVKQAKSPNRLVAGLHGGRFVVAHPLPAYAPYAEFAWVGEDLCQGIEWAIEHPRQVVERIAHGQAYIDEKHSPEAVARFWLDVFHPKN